MIRAILVFNNHGKPRLIKFYEHYKEDVQQQIVRETFQLVAKRDENVCNFLEGGSLIGGSDYRLIYRHYATLYFVFCVDSCESELGILDLIQAGYFEVAKLRATFLNGKIILSALAEMRAAAVGNLEHVFVETLDKCFENVCELDMIFHVDKVHHILDEIVMGGMVLETSMSEIVMRIEEQTKLEKQEAGLSSAPGRAVNAVKNIDLTQIRDIKLPDIQLPAFKNFKLS